MAKINSIQTLARRGWSQRRIARELGIDRGTVRHHLAECPPDSKPAKVTTGEIGGEEANPAKVTTGSEHAKPAKVTAGAQSRCRGCEGLIEDKLKLGLHAQRIWQDLVSEQQFEGSYESVKRFVRKLRERDPARVWRMEGEPGEEAQVDFGLGAPLREPTGRTVRTWVFRIILSHSRKGYSEAVRRQDTETFIRCLENAFRAFGGVPASLNVDNLKAAVLKADWYDPELNPKLAAFCAHYGTVLAPSRPYRPQDKGKVEAGVKYVRYNALKGRVFESLAAENAFLRQWEEQVADQRIHGTTRQQVRQRFLEVEKAALRPLAGDLFPAYQEAQRRVHRDRATWRSAKPITRSPNSISTASSGPAGTAAKCACTASKVTWSSPIRVWSPASFRGTWAVAAAPRVWSFRWAIGKRGRGVWDRTAASGPARHPPPGGPRAARDPGALCARPQTSRERLGERL